MKAPETQQEKGSLLSHSQWRGRLSLYLQSRGDSFCSHGPSDKGREARYCPQHHPAHPSCLLPQPPPCSSALSHSCPIILYLSPPPSLWSPSSCLCHPLRVSATLKSDKEQCLSAHGEKNQFTRFHLNPSVLFLINVLVPAMGLPCDSNVQQILIARSVRQMTDHCPLARDGPRSSAQGICPYTPPHPVF